MFGLGWLKMLLKKMFLVAKMDTGGQKVFQWYVVVAERAAFVGIGEGSACGCPSVRRGFLFGPFDKSKNF